MASKEYIIKRIDGKQKELAKLEKKLARIRKVESQNWEDPNPYFYTEQDLKWCLKDLEKVQKDLEGYQEDLKVVLEKEASRNVQIIIDFLEMWKERNHDFYMEAMKEFTASWNELKDLNSKIEQVGRYTEEGKELAKVWEEKSKEHHINLHGVYEYQMVKEWHYSYKEHKNILTEVKKKVKVEDGKWEYASRYLDRNIAEGESRLNADLNEEANRKYDFIIERTNAIVGTITDASNLKIGAKGDLNGYIIGTNGTAKVQTIGAGGYNIQCFHFRTLVTDMK